jgi:hypothetical protein
MNPSLTTAIVFACLFGAALLGMRLRRWLPDQHLNAETKEAVRIGMATVATMAALMLGLLVASTKQSFDTKKDEVIQFSAKLIYLDHVLSNYGPETAEIRDLLRNSVQAGVNRVWPDENTGQSRVAPSDSLSRGMPTAIQKLSPKNDSQTAFKSQAAQLISDLAQMRWLLFEQSESSFSFALLAIMVFWLALTFVSVGLFAPANATAIAAQMMAALAVSGAIFLLVELDQPFSGFAQVSREPVLNALEFLGK